MADKINITIEQGATFYKEYTYEANAALDVASMTASMRKHYTSTNAFSFTAQFTSNTVVISMTYTVTANLVPGRYLYDVRALTTSNTVFRIVEGLATVTPAMTRS